MSCVQRSPLSPASSYAGPAACALLSRRLIRDALTVVAQSSAPARITLVRRYRKGA